MQSTSTTKRRPRKLVPTLLGLLAVVPAVVVAGCGSASGGSATPAGRANQAPASTQAAPPASSGASTTPNPPAPSQAAAKPAPGVPQANGGDADPDNNGGSDDGDGGI
jgi:hypothetical protein